MLTTAKSIQLLDVNGMNISPITDITSLYYEVENPKDKSIISRKYVYDAFPVGVNIDPVNLINIGTPTRTGGRHPGDGSLLYKNGQLYKIVDSSKNDILVSRIDTGVIPGTTLRELKVTNYNLSEILSYYTPLDLMDASCHALDVSINNINTSIRDISTRITTLRASLDAIDVSLSKIIEWSKNNLIPNKFYLIKDYYAGNNGCMALPNPSTNFGGPESGSSLSLLIKANDSSNLDGNLYEMYDHSGKALKVHGTYKLENNKIRITYMKDQYGNEAPYDFYNLKYKPDNTYYYTFGTNSINSNIQNNIIKTDPYTFGSMPLMCYSTSNLSILKNNYIGYDSSVFIYSNGSNLSMQNNIISNNCSIYMNSAQLLIYNNTIHNNNILRLPESGNKKLQNTIINSSNNIIVNGSKLNNIIINSANNITLYKEASNATILNNCDGIINLSDNIIIDNYINMTANSSLNTSPNSVYLFGQDVYARSFNTIKAKVEKTLLYLNVNGGSTVIEIYDDIITQSAITNAIGGGSLTKCEIGNNVTSIDNNAFNGYSKLRSITIGNSVTSIGNNAFEGCSRLTFIGIPKNVTSIGQLAFYNCFGLNSFGVQSDNPNYCQVGGVLFNKNRTTLIQFPCARNQYILPANVTSIEQYAFAGCQALASLSVYSQNRVYDSRYNCNAIIETATNTLIVGCKDTSIGNTNNTITSIGRSAFYGCISLSSIEIPNSIVSIEDQAFYGCTGLSSIEIPNRVQYIGDEAFCDCINLKYIKYDGYRKDWYEIQLGGIGWNKNIPCKIVQCLDGDLYLNEYFDTIGVFDDVN